LKELEKLSVVVGKKKFGYIDEIHKSPNYETASCKLTARHLCSCGKWMRGRYWVLVERLVVCDPSDELDREGSEILKEVVNTQGNHLIESSFVNSAMNFQIKMLRIF
jgi:hypothetical protein